VPKYLSHGSYTVEGVRGVIKEGGSARKAHFHEIVADLGGKVEAFYFALGGSDVYSIVDLPDNVSSATVSLALNAGGGFHASTVVLITPEEMDQAVQKTASARYRPPGESR